ncbi:flagellar biosynthesis protein FlhF [Halomonas sp. IOP_31]|uniref:flagellar biosynthesis protein FlhF n=1 Tax=Halomonas sp. IOP_31 TaxID=2876584 RepID=UPI001E3FF371|nr:flagellar biosynthesis protein FlhF [Halomonas sp. IOP_31]MCD6008396.1 flagellar biosynthesis protein FlhF [Halomonas sp. IOP_31]
MSVRRFIAANSRDAMRQVRAALGEDALILANRRVDAGVEILALAEEPGPADALPVERQAAPREPQAGAASSAARAYLPERQASQSPPVPSRPAPVASVTPAAAQPAPAGNQDQGPPGDFAAFSARLLDEMQDLRMLIADRQARQEPAAGEADKEDNRHRLNCRLQNAGFGNALARELLDALPGELVHGDPSGAAAWLHRQLGGRLEVLEDEAGLLDQGGVFALLGPTGIGKTTTTAKLAARYVMRHGAGGVALITTDSYRVGAHEQLRIYARLLGVEVHALADDAPLGELLAQLDDKRLVIIDTVGMSQRDQRLVGQVAMLGESSQNAPRPVRRLLLLNAASHGETLDEVVETYQRASLAAGAPLYGAILTKVDEAPRLGAVLDIAIRHGLRLHYVSQGQQVPEDLQLADRQALVDQALAVGDDSAFSGDPLEWQRTSSPRRWKSLSRGLFSQGRNLATLFARLREHVGGFAQLESAWPWLGYPLQAQQQQLPRLHAAWRGDGGESAAFGSEPSHGLLWPRSAAVKGSDWYLPAVPLNSEGLAQTLPWATHHQPAGESQKLHFAARLGLHMQWLPRCPVAATRHELDVAGVRWVATTQANTRVSVDGVRHKLAALAAHATPEASRTCRYRGRSVRLKSARLAVALDSPDSLTAWFVNLSDPDSGRSLAHRYWLMPSGDAANGLAAFAAQLAHEELPLLARRAWQWLAPSQAMRVDDELRVWIATALASLAIRLDQEQADWAVDVRGQLLSMLGSGRKRSARALLEALWYLFTARDALLLASGQMLDDRTQP